MPYTSIFFPGLGLTLNPTGVLTIGPFTIHIYGLIIGLGLILAVVYAMKRSTEFGLTQDDLLDGVLWVTPFAILCARAYYCVFAWEEFAHDPISVLYIWNGGIAIYGGVLGAVAGVAVFCKIKKVRFTSVLDLVLMGFLIGQCLGRWGNFFNREAFGAPVPENYFLAMGLFNPISDSYEFYHPTFLYESVWNGLGFLLLHLVSRHRRYDGQIALGYAAWYGLGRAFIEGLRMDSLWWGPFRVSQVLAAVTCVAAVGVLVWQSFRPHDPQQLFGRVKARQLQEAAEKASEQPEEE